MSPDNHALPRYRVAHLTLASELPLPELAASSGAADWTLRLGGKRPRPPRGGWFHHWDSPQGRRWLSFGREDGTVLLRFTRTATFRVTPDRGTIVCEGATRVPARTIRHLLLNQVVPLALSGRDRVVLHASGVADDDGVVAFAGPAGSGKSTLAATCAHLGRALVSDDALIIDVDGATPTTMPLYDSVRLWPETAAAVFGTSADYPTVSHYTSKRLVSIAAAPDAARLPLRVIALLAPPAQMRRSSRAVARRLSPREALIRLTKLVFQLDVEDRGGVSSAFGHLSTIVERVPTVEVAFPWRLSRVHATARDVLDALGGAVSGAGLVGRVGQPGRMVQVDS